MKCNGCGAEIEVGTKIWITDLGCCYETTIITHAKAECLAEAIGYEEVEYAGHIGENETRPKNTYGYYSTEGGCGE